MSPLLSNEERAAGQVLSLGATQSDQRAFAALHDELAGPLFALALWIVKDRTLAEDALQDAFVQIWRKALSYDPEKGSVLNWAMMIVRHRAIDRVRRQSVQQGLIDRIALLDAGSDMLPSIHSADRITESREEAALVRRALADLPAQARDCIELAFFEDLTYEEVAARLRQPLGSVKTRIRRGLLRMRETLRRQCPGNHHGGHARSDRLTGRCAPIFPFIQTDKPMNENQTIPK